MTKAALYARVSGDDRNNATSSIAAQLKDGRAYAKERGYEVVGEFAEDADRHTSGADMLPELEKLLRLAAQNFFDVLIVRELDRLARNRFKQLSVENQLERLGVRVEYVIGRYEDTAEGRLLKGLMSEFAEFEREKIKQRTQRGILNTVKAGNVLVAGSNATYGYDLGEKDGRRVLVVNEAEAAIVRKIFDMYGNQGYTLPAIIDWLNEHKIPKPGKGENHKYKNRRGKWTPATLSWMLNNETYVGRWYFGKKKTIKDATGKTRCVARPRSEWVLVDVPALIPETLFDLVQERRAQNKQHMGRRRKNFYLLSGKVDCGHCGNGVSGVTKELHGKKWVYYKCNAHHTPGRYGYRCVNIQFNVEDVDTAVWGWVKELLLLPERLNENLAAYQEQQRAAHQPLVSMIAANEQKLTAAKAEKERLIKAYAAGVLTLDEITSHKTAIDKEITDLTAAIAALRAEFKPNLLTAGQVASIQEWAAKIRVGAEVILDSDPAGAQEILRLLQTRVTLGHEDGRRWLKVRCVLGEEFLAARDNMLGGSTVG